MVVKDRRAYACIYIYIYICVWHVFTAVQTIYAFIYLDKLLFQCTQPVDFFHSPIIRLNSYETSRGHRRNVPNTGGINNVSYFEKEIPHLYSKKKTNKSTNRLPSLFPKNSIPTPNPTPTPFYMDPFFPIENSPIPTLFHIVFFWWIFIQPPTLCCTDTFPPHEIVTRHQPLNPP